MRFTDFLRATVLLSAASATVLAAIAVARATAEDRADLVLAGAVWWALAAASGAAIGRRRETSTPIARLLADAKSQTALPEVEPARILLNRLWPLLVSTLLAAGAAFAAPQVPAIACGFAVIWALAWRRQEAAVAAIEDRDGVRFVLERTSPFRPIRLVRTPGLKADVGQRDGAAV